ncbi:NUDIX hydrolase [Actinomycetospora lutea]|uniref:NUDIX hydrolase n=1 Tax=Actinomycetospora lutea TaxID=663604 RepID=UPI0023652E56|nr:NUDIX hydrolase [Actinomycetospora lutea]MDD7938680.1 NUDIX hydrolase [Actinomycetospora lutea]
MADTPKHSVSVAGIVVDDQDRVLVIQRRDNGHWEPPGGVLELGERPEAGVEREVLEETGVRVEVLRLSGVYKNMRKGVVALVFRCRPLVGIERATLESRQARWVSKAELRMLMDEAYAVRVDDAFSQEVAVRSHDGLSLL